MKAKEYIDNKKVRYITLCDAHKAIDMARNEFAEDIIKMIDNYREHRVKGDIAEYVRSYCEGYCEGMKIFSDSN